MDDVRTLVCREMLAGSELCQIKITYSGDKSLNTREQEKFHYKPQDLFNGILCVPVLRYICQYRTVGTYVNTRQSVMN